MAWIESHQELAAHPKTLRLAGRLGIPKAQALGHLHLLWWWAMHYADDGDLSEFTEWEVAGAAEWPGDPNEFVKAMMEAGWLDETPDGSVIHDWHDYAGKLVERRVLNRQRSQAARDRARTVSTPLQHGVRTERERMRLPNPTQPSEPKGSAPTAREHLFVAFYEYWMRKAYIPKVTTMTKSERGRINKAADEALEAGITPDEVKIRGRKYRKDWPKMEHTPQALLGNWTRFEPVEEGGLPDCKKCGNRRIVPVDGDESTASEFRRCSCVGQG